jgi:hypothetical protein
LQRWAVIGHDADACIQAAAAAAAVEASAAVTRSMVAGIEYNALESRNSSRISRLVKPFQSLEGLTYHATPK